ncbi:hypothetical protein [Verrucomicrobium spinosum]|uniref:hypothetical protein n=1 Tax=Verrucomicrobium spinosum TaxID=2736 RepID=UPI0012F69E0C|nr:hypothetical protein [Verrucomicrobium spinosum]
MDSILSKFDSFLSQSDSDSMDWNDGGDYEIAQEMLDKFSPEEWDQLREMIPNRPALWRNCVIYSVEPKKGNWHSELLLDFVFDTDHQLSLEATHRVAFYCGALHGKNGITFDPRIRSEHMIQTAKSRPGLEAAIARLQPECNPILLGLVNVMFNELGIAPIATRADTATTH